MSIYDIWDQATNTEIVRRAVESTLAPQSRPARSFATQRPTSQDKIKKRRMYVQAVGKGRFVSDDATPPVWRPRLRIDEEFVELIRLSEMSPIEESLLRQLRVSGTDDESKELRMRAGADLLTIARGLQMRNENLSDYLVMQSVINGKFDVVMADEPSQTLELNYDYLPTHLPTVATSWATLASSTPITDLQAWQNLLADDAGDYGIHIWLSSKVWRYLRDSKQVKDFLTGTDRPLFIAQQEEVKELLEEPERVQFHITDAGWLEEGAGDGGFASNHNWGRKDFTKWLPEDRIIMTTADPYNGEPIAEMFDGLVGVQTDWNRLDFRPGMQSEVLVDGKPKVHWWIQTSRRMLRINLPENLIVAKVVI